MLDLNDLLIVIKKAALDAIEATQPSDFCFGSVISDSPLKIKIEQKLTLGSAQLILTERVHKTYPLVVGDEVVLLKQKGGQKYLVIDRAVIP